MGEEPYYIDVISNYIIEHVLSEAEKGFNQTIVYGKDSDARTIDNHAKRYPMMSNYQVVVVKEAQDLKDIDELHHYVERPLNSTILVLCYKYKKYDGKKKLYKAAQKSGVVFESKKLYDNQIPSWIEGYLKGNNYSIQPEAAQMLTEFLGSGLSKIVNELDKLMLVLKPGTKITPADIEKNIGISKEFNVFELQVAMGMKDQLKIGRIVNYFIHNPKDNPLTVIISQLYSYFNKLFLLYFIKDKSSQNLASVLQVHPYFVKDYTNAQNKYPSRKLLEVFSILREFDLKSKGVDSSSTEQGELLKEMIFKITH